MEHSTSRPCNDSRANPYRRVRGPLAFLEVGKTSHSGTLNRSNPDQGKGMNQKAV